MSKIAREMYESCLRELLWQASQDLGPEAVSKIVFGLLQEHSQELAAFATEQGVLLTKPERAA